MSNIRIPQDRQPAEAILLWWPYHLEERGHIEFNATERQRLDAEAEALTLAARQAASRAGHAKRKAKRLAAARDAAMLAILRGDDPARGR